MTNERKYDRDETREIFVLATRGVPGEAVRSDADGLTLAELQEIGVEVGLDRAQIARAARTLDTPASAVAVPRPTTTFGMPNGVGREVLLARAPTDVEWDRIVSELRSTFGARGKVLTTGGLREWVNGNLHACIEPAESGYRLRMGTRKNNAQPLNYLGAAGVAMGLVTGAALAQTVGFGEPLPYILGVSGVTALLSNYVRLPRWARTRESQMDHIAARVHAMLQSPPND